MDRKYFIGMDVHCKSSVVKLVTAGGRLANGWEIPTTIPAIREVLKQVRRPRALAIEEGPMADWLYRNLYQDVDEMIVCNPRRNRLIAAEGDHDDPVDAEKLAQLLRGGYLKPVHHGGDLRRRRFKQWVQLYDDRVGDGVRLINKVKAMFRAEGVMSVPRGLFTQTCREEVLAGLEDPVIRDQVQMMLVGYDAVKGQVQIARRHLQQYAKVYEPIGRFRALPGVGLIRAAVFFVHVDTPWRFQKKNALWRYMGIGLERWRSGSGPERLRLARDSNRRLKHMILSAAKTAIGMKRNPFRDQYERMVSHGVTASNAGHTVARTMATVLWGLWKNGSAYREELVGPRR